MLNTVNASNAADFNFALSDGTPVVFTKITTKNNIQVRLPDTHYLADDDALRIFNRDGNHFKDATDGLTLVATLKTQDTPVAPTPTPSNDDTTIPCGSVIVIKGVAYALYAIGPVVDLAA